MFVDSTFIIAVHFYLQVQNVEIPIAPNPQPDPDDKKNNKHKIVNLAIRNWRIGMPSISILNQISEEEAKAVLSGNTEESIYTTEGYAQTLANEVASSKGQKSVRHTPAYGFKNKYETCHYHPGTDKGLPHAWFGTIPTIKS